MLLFSATLTVSFSLVFNETPVILLGFFPFSICLLTSPWTFSPLWLLEFFFELSLDVLSLGVLKFLSLPRCILHLLICPFLLHSQTSQQFSLLINPLLPSSNIESFLKLKPLFVNTYFSLSLSLSPHCISLCLTIMSICFLSFTLSLYLFPSISLYLCISLFLCFCFSVCLFLYHTLSFSVRLYLSICISFSLPDSLSLSLSLILSLSLCVFVSDYLFLFVSLCLCISLSLSLFFCHCLYLSVPLSLSLSLCLSLLSVWKMINIHNNIYLSIYLSIYLYLLKH
ncbi:unnamed protein product [Acanthosepion pharaonis]|uniref:Uncharacterized protein n=1 Tax=Acanthosepion pharaonis TaxID=158019 RepID=A0A812DBY2_ACAPH|nr:unnamed protein product [Sepia pharaonis]